MGKRQRSFRSRRSSSLSPARACGFADVPEARVSGRKMRFLWLPSDATPLPAWQGAFAWAGTLCRRKRPNAGNPVVFWKDGKNVSVPPEQIPVDDDK